MWHTLSLGAVLAILWWLLSGMGAPLLLGLGAVSVVLTVWFAHRMDVADHEGHPIHLGPRAILYFPWLIKEIIVSSWDTAKIILSPKMNIQPHTFKTKTTQLSPVGKTTYANSITLTPGTVTISMEETGVFEVHALNHAFREGVETGEMDRRCTSMEGMTEEVAEADAKRRAQELALDKITPQFPPVPETRKDS